MENNFADFICTNIFGLSYSNKPDLFRETQKGFAGEEKSEIEMKLVQETLSTFSAPSWIQYFLCWAAILEYYTFFLYKGKGPPCTCVPW